jgi:hypothetical protein
MDRGSSKHNPRVDEQLAEEVQGTVHGVAGSRAEEWKMAEPSGEDQPETTVAPDFDYGSGEPAGVGNAQAERFSRFASYIGRSAFPGDREALLRSAADLDAPDDVVEALGRLPGGTRYQNAADVWNALGQ